MNARVDNITKIAKKVLRIESSAVLEQVGHIDDSFVEALKLINSTIDNFGKVIVTGVGKSGLVARKISATFSSVGAPSVFVNLTELVHGDLGMISPRDLIFILSYSGESDELKNVLPSIKSIGPKVLVMTGEMKSYLGRLADCTINVSVKKEACPYNVVPTASTTAMLALGDALALSVSAMRGFKKSDFAKFHPGGSLGKKMTLKVADLMHRGSQNPVIRERATVREALLVMTKTKLGAVSVIDGSGRLSGYFTDGDLRRKLQKDDKILARRISEVMTHNPITVTPEHLAAAAAEIMKSRNCDNLPVIDKAGRPVGIIDERDLISSGII